MIDQVGRNQALMEAIVEADWTYEAVARAIRAVAAETGEQSRCNKSAVAHWVAGTRKPSGRTPLFLAEAFGRKLHRTITPADLGLPSPEDGTNLGLILTPRPLAVITRLGKADLDRRGFLVNAVYSLGALGGPLAYRQEILDRGTYASADGAAVGSAEITAVRDITAMLSKADEIHGGFHARAAVVAYLSTDVAAYCRGRFRSEADRRAMFGAAAQLAYLAGFKAHDAGMDGLAERYYLQAFQLACESDPGAHAGYILRILAHQALDMGQRDRCVDLAEAALDRVHGRVDLETQSLFVLTHAYALAAEGRSRESALVLDRAESAMRRAGDEAGPTWAALGGPPDARLASNAGKTFSLLGDYRATEKQFARSTSCWNAVSHRRIYALDLSGMAEAQCAQGKVEQACDTWNKALDHMEGVRSARTCTAIMRMRTYLAAYRGRGLEVAARLDRRGHTVLTHTEQR